MDTTVLGHLGASQSAQGHPDVSRSGVAEALQFYQASRGGCWGLAGLEDGIPVGQGKGGKGGGGRLGNSCRSPVRRRQRSLGGGSGDGERREVKEGEQELIDGI